MTYTLFVDRTYGTINCKVTLQEVTGLPKALHVTQHFKQLPAVSGQPGYTAGGSLDWVTGKGAIPMGHYWLSTVKRPLELTPVGSPFFLISDQKGQDVIKGPKGKQRELIGLHLDNKFLGSSGCVALKPGKQADDLLSKIEWLGLQGLEYIKVVVL